MKEENISCEVCGRVYMTAQEGYYKERKALKHVTFMCDSCYKKRNAEWAEREKQYRTPDGRQKRW